jgi:hypothetical protein
VGEPIQRVLMALRVFGDPTVPTASGEPGEDFTPGSSDRATIFVAARERAAGRGV